MKNVNVKEAKDIYNNINSDEYERNMAFRREIQMMDENTLKLEGLKEGEEKGKKEGLKEAQISMAKKMLKDGIDINVIMKYTGLTESEIKTLK